VANDFVKRLKMAFKGEKWCVFAGVEY